MLQISRFTCEGLTSGCVTDKPNPAFSFALESDRNGAALMSATLFVNGETIDAQKQIGVRYAGKALEPFTAYTATLTVADTFGETATASLSFATGRMDTPWEAKWISDGAYIFKEKKISPKPMHFRKMFRAKKLIDSATIYATAFGVYELYLNGEKVGNRYFAPGFTSYATNLQYQTYDVTEQLEKRSVIDVAVAGGWAVGSFVYTRINRVAADRQALLLELRVRYQDGTTEVIGTDETWDVTEDGPFRMVDLYDGETYDASVELDKLEWRKATLETPRSTPAIYAELGAPVTAHERFAPLSCTKVGNVYVYDFGQNLAGVVHLAIRNAKRGQVITVRHAEILNPDGSLNVAFLRTAKATATYTCIDGEQTYMPSMSYMGFRYVSIEGIEPEDVQPEAVALYSDLEPIGSFRCSNEMLNKLQSNIQWGAKSNLVDIPTDCPQRDERMGWTGDIAVFSPAACFNFRMDRFLDKWLKDVRAEQTKGGGFPNTIPANGFHFPMTMPDMAIDWWGDACVLVPWALYLSDGDKTVLAENYEMMQKYVKACAFWAGLLSLGKHRYIWNTLSTFHFGDWVAPDVPKMTQWQGRAKWTATASLYHTSSLLEKIAVILDKQEDAEKYRTLSRKVADAYESLLTDGNGKLKNEFQTAYVLPLQFGMFRNETEPKVAKNLAALVERANYCIGTGFPGTPYILFALADHGYADEAYKMLLNTKCPSWLYEVKQGATTIWERWDGLDENGVCPIGNDGTDAMISYNHYASGAVGDFLYRRVAGLEPTEPGYKRFAVRPLLGGDLTSASADVQTPYGKAAVAWTLEEGLFTLTVTVPIGCECVATFPNGRVATLQSGTHTLKEQLFTVEKPKPKSKYAFWGWA